MGAIGLAMALTALSAVALPARAGATAFGLHGYDVTFTNADGSPATQAGSHPFQMTTTFRLDATELRPEAFSLGELKDATFQQIPGLIGDTTAVPRCPLHAFLTSPEGEARLTECSNDTAVGVAELNLHLPTNKKYVPVYNLVPNPGEPARIGFDYLGVRTTVGLGVKPGGEYNVLAKVVNTPQTIKVFGSSLTLWGIPADPAHDLYRGLCLLPNGESEGECPSSAPLKPFLTLPRACTGPLVSTVTADSWFEPGRSVSYETLTHDNGEPPTPIGMTGCERLGFNPTISAKPTSVAASSSTGLDFALNVHDEGLTSAAGLAQSDIKKTVVTLPEGMTANPSLAEGLGVCSEEQLARETAASAPGEGCPEESKIGTVEVETPLLDEPLRGSLFMAKPYANPFDSLLAVYFVIKNPALGVVVRQPAEVEPDPQTGRLVTVVDNIPQLPFSHFALHFREGARSPLVTPPACGSYDAKAELFPWSGGAPVVSDSMFQIVSGVNASACPVGGTPPFAPQVSTGTLNNAAGSYSQFDLRITREDGEQELTRFSTLLPPGLTGNLTGIPFCPDSAIEAARQRTGAQEIAEPSCPAASEIGHTLVGAGVGGVLAWAPGKLYLAGPYNGAPLSIVSITAAKVGPFDLGTVVIRFALSIDPNTAQVHLDAAASDPIPHIIDGIVVNVREIHAYVDRERFILNPTSCDPMAIQNIVQGAGANIASAADDTSVTLNSPFQAADCANLTFKPDFKVSTSGKTSKANGASLTVKLAYPNAPQGTQSNIHLVKVELPKQLPSRLTTLQKACTAAQFRANPAGCPAASVVGRARAITPVLPVPLEGPAYFVSNGGEAFPNLIMVLQGYGITIDLVGTTFISKAGITSSTFKTVPDQPVSSFELTLPQGPYSALAANGSLCASKLSMPTEMIGQNGAPVSQSTPVSVTGCPKAKPLTRAQKLAQALGTCHKKPKGAKRKACERAARKKYGPVKKAKKTKK
jgi:hypothetical protein